MSFNPGLVTSTPQASLVLLDATPDPRSMAPGANTTAVAQALMQAQAAGSVLLWNSDAEQFHLYTEAGAFVFRRNEMSWPGGTTLRGEDLGALLDAQDCGPAQPLTSFAGRFSTTSVTLTTALPQDLPAAPPGTVAVLGARHTGGTRALEGDGEQLHLRTTEGWFSFRGNCVTFPHGQMLCGEELCPPPLPLVIGAPGSSWQGGGVVGTFLSNSWQGGGKIGGFTSQSWQGGAIV